MITIAFDADGVIFDSTSQKVCDEKGRAAFSKHEAKNKNKLLKSGPCWNLFIKLIELRNLTKTEEQLLKIILITSRGLHEGERLLKTLSVNRIELDAVIFTNGGAKGPLLQAQQVDLFFDDKDYNISNARAYNILSMLVEQ